MTVSDDEARARLREIEGDLTFLKGELPQPTGEAGDYADAGTDLGEREQQQALIEDLEAERDRLREQLGED